MAHKFLHLSDVHLGTPFLCRSESLRNQLRKELHDAFQRAVDFAISEKMIAVLIAGDLLDERRFSLSTETFLLEQLRRLDEAQIPCIYVAGESDPGGALSKTMNVGWPTSFVHIKERTPKVIELQDIDGSAIVRIVGVGRESGHGESLPAMPLPEAQGSVPYVGILHTRLDSSNLQEDSAEKIQYDVEDLKHADYVYWALGGNHTRSSVDDVNNAWYSGNLAGTGAMETGPKGGMIVTLEPDSTVDVQFKAFSGVKWHNLVLDNLQKIQFDEDLIRLVEQEFAVDQEGNDPSSLQIVQITLSGICPIAEDLRAEAHRTTVEEKIAGRLGVDSVELRLRNLTLPVDVDAYRDKPHLLGEVLKLIEAVSEQDGLFDELAPEPLASKNVSGDDRQAYLTRLLNGLDREAVVRLTHEDNHAN